MFNPRQRSTTSVVHNSPATSTTNNSPAGGSFNNNNPNTATRSSNSRHGTSDDTIDVVLSPAFFQRYDALFQASSSIESAQLALQQATKKRNEVQTHLTKLQQALQSNRDFAKEQRDRIAMVETHWFYGTTALQPQLWLRGGRQGKIDRARAKLEKAEQAYPALLQQVEHVQTIQLAQVDEQVARCQYHYTVSSTAVALRTSMKERALSEYPSMQWRNWKEQVARVTQDRAVFQGQVEQLTKASTLYQQAQSQYYQQAQTTFQTAMEHANRYQQLQHEAVPPLYNSTPPLIYPNNAHQYWKNKQCTSMSTSTGTSSKNGEGSPTTIVTLQNTYRSRHSHIPTKVVLTYDSNGRLIATNIPCPNSCGFLISPWHGTYCCGACQRGGGGGGGAATTSARSHNQHAKSHNQGVCRHSGRRQDHHHHGHHHGKGYPHQSHAQGHGHAHAHAHGGRCNQLPVSAQDGSQQLLRSWNNRLDEHEKEKERQWKLSHQKLTEGHNHVQQGNALVKKALLLIPIAVQAKHTTLANAQLMGQRQRTGASNHSAELSSLANTNNNNVHLLIQSIGTAMGWMAQCQSSSQVEDSMLQRVKTQIQTEEINMLQQKLEGVLVCLQQEEDRVWNELRARALIMAEPNRHAATTPSGSSGAAAAAAMPHAATAPVVPIVTLSSTPVAVPSAPPEDDSDQDHDHDHSHYHQPCDRPSAFAPQYRPSSSTSSTYLADSTFNFSPTSTITPASSVRSTDTSCPVAMAEMTTSPWSSEISPSIIPMAHAVLLDS